MVASRHDVAVVGAGMVGISTALYLQAQGRDVVVIERTAPGDGASGHNGGVFSLANCLPVSNMPTLLALPSMLRAQDSAVSIDPLHLPRALPWSARFLRASSPKAVRHAARSIASLLREAMDAYQPLFDDAIRPTVHEGLLYVYPNEAAFSGSEWARLIQNEVGVEFEIVDRDWLGRYHPGLGRSFCQGMYVPKAGFTYSPLRVNQALAEKFVAGGGRLHIASAQSFLQNGNGVAGVQTSIEGIGARDVVLAAGAWSKPLARQLGMKALLDSERGYGFEIPDVDVGLPSAVIDAHLHVAFTPMNGALRVTGIDEFGGITRPPKEKLFARVRSSALRTFPDLDFSAARRWMSYRPSTPDSMPYLGRIPGHRNVYAAFGHNHIGFTLGGISGRLISELIDGRTPSVDMTPFDPNRFGARRTLATRKR
jgi:D-amino-acid dehydrogenase